MFKVKVKVSRPSDGAAAPGAAPVGPYGTTQMGAPMHPAAGPPLAMSNAVPSHGALLPSSGAAHGGPADPKKRKRPDEQAEPSSFQAEQQPQLKRQYQEGLAAPASGGGGNKFKLNIKKPSGQPSALSSAASQDTSSAVFVAQPSSARLPNLRGISQIQNQVQQAIAQPAPHLSLGQQPFTTNQQRAREMAPVGGAAIGADKPLAKSAQRSMLAAEHKAQAKLEKERQVAAKKQEKEAAQAQKLAAQEQQEQLAAVMGKAFGGAKFKIKVKTPAGPAPPAPGAPPAAGMVPLPSANGSTATTQAPKPTSFRVKLAKPGGLPRAPVGSPGMHAPQHAAPSHLDSLLLSDPSGGLGMAAMPAGGSNVLHMPRPVGAPGVAGRGRGRGFGAGRPPGPKRPRPDDEEFDPSTEMPSPPRQPRAPRQEATGHTLVVLMGKVLEGLGKKDEVQGNIFKAPVSDELVPGYSAKITNPMCYDVMRRKLQEGAYPKWEHFEADLALVYSNAQTFNPPGSFVHHHANYLRDVTKKYLQQAKQGNTNFRGVAAGITRKYQAEWVRTHPPKAASQAERQRPMSQARAASTASLEMEEVPLPAARVPEARKARMPTGAAAAARERHSSLAAGPAYGRGHRTHANVSYAADLEPGQRPPRGSARGSRGTAKGAHVSRSVRASDPDARKMAAVYIRRNELEELRDTYHLAVPPAALPLATWRGLAAGATAEGADYATGAFALHPMWPGALYPNLAAAVQAHTQGGASFNGAGLPQDSYARSVARFVRRCHPALRKLVASDRLASCLAVEGAPEPAPSAVPTPAPRPTPAPHALAPGTATPGLPGDPAQPTNSMQQPGTAAAPLSSAAMVAQPAVSQLVQRGLPLQQLGQGVMPQQQHVPGGMLQQRHSQGGTPQQQHSQVGAPQQRLSQGGMPHQQQGVMHQQHVSGGMSHQQPVQGGMPHQQHVHGGMPHQQPVQGGMPHQQPVQGGMPQQQPVQGGMPQQQPVQGGMPQQQPVQGGMPQQQYVQGGMAQQQHVQGGMPQQQSVQGGMPQQQHVQGGGMPHQQGGMPQQLHIQGGMPQQQHVQGNMQQQQHVQGGMPQQQHVQGGMQQQQHVQGGMPQQQHVQGGMQQQQPVQGGMPHQQHLQGDMPHQQHVQGGVPQQQNVQGGMQQQQPVQGGMPHQQHVQGGIPTQPQQAAKQPQAAHPVGIRSASPDIAAATLMLLAQQSHQPPDQRQVSVQLPAQQQSNGLSKHAASLSGQLNGPHAQSSLPSAVASAQEEEDPPGSPLPDLPPASPV